ncbi:FAD/NAD(P)-binding oxidoreductase [Rhodococcus oxybenzonivorans]|uniref:NAD(P)/FAD-dependent oxidoreductase n=1 Tax=Rhodococcus oxybenzonivorans TaxID=1990687 RepID=UPI002953D84F|nr:FAD/NAD(P)-binding oxidoreductase [Rhodococcus oxybenzonivorans]MDV7354903.1 FAD/NAD(P)-binding oxidoreductase [Rhodococcus oxybenzonivorans]
MSSDMRVVIVGASLAGLRAADELRRLGFDGPLTMIGDEPYEPYDRPPLSKAVLLGIMPPEHATLPARTDLDAKWRLGVPAIALDIEDNRVVLGDGDSVPFDKVLLTTGVRARPWPKPEESDLDGVFTVRTLDDSRRLDERLSAGPGHVLVIGAGFTGSEIASVCRERGLSVTVTERGPAPLVGALGGVVAAVAADMQRDHGVDLRCGITVARLEGDGQGRLRRAHLSDGTALDVDVAVVAQGSIRNTEWLAGSGLAAGPRGVACDAGCRAFDLNGLVTDNVFVAGDIARQPHPLYDYQLIALEHWGNAIGQAEVAAHNMIHEGLHRRPHLDIPAFWSSQFGVNIKSVGIPTYSDQVVATQGSFEERRFVAAYGFRGRLTAAVAFNHGRWLDFYRDLIESAAAFPPDFAVMDRTDPWEVRSSELPDPAILSHGPTVSVTGHLPTERHVEFVSAPK